MKRGIVHSLTLLTSFSTLICCALPALFVALGAGAALAGVVSAVPQLIWISEHKVGVFIFAGIMLTLSGILRYRSRHAACPSDPKLAMACSQTRRWSGSLYALSLCIYVTGGFFAFVAPYLVG